MNNPYTILGINQDATDEEIEKARKRALKLNCSIDQNAKDENGEYLSDIINKAADNLLNKERRRQIDERLDNTKNIPTIYSSSELPSQIILTSINTELVKNKISLQKIHFNVLDIRKIKCEDLYLGVLSTGECMYLLETSEKYSSSTYLIEYYSKTRVTEEYRGFSNKPWHKGEAFDIDENLIFVYPIYRVLPKELITNGKISKNILRAILPILQEVLKNNADELNKLFNKGQEKVKIKKK